MKKMSQTFSAEKPPRKPKEYGNLVTCREDFEEYKDKNATILGISTDSIKRHVNFTKKHDLKITLLSDPNHDVIEKYDSWKPKKMYGKEFLGTERNTFLINPEGKIDKIWKKVKVKGHSEEIKVSLDLLMSK